MNLFLVAWDTMIPVITVPNNLGDVVSQEQILAVMAWVTAFGFGFMSGNQR